MAGPVWRFEEDLVSSCAVCFREAAGVFVEGEVRDNRLARGRTVCQDCYRRSADTLAGGESGDHVWAPAYGKKP
jgi:hypothetical protein